MESKINAKKRRGTLQASFVIFMLLALAKSFYLLAVAFGIISIVFTFFPKFINKTNKIN
jgi:hypothetical protein